MDYKLLCYLMVCLLVEISKSNAESECSHQCIQSDKCNSKRIHNKCYYIFKDSLRRWDGSELLCQKQNLSMVKVTREMINTGFNVSDLLRGLPAVLFNNTLEDKNHAWLGGRAVNIGEWKFLIETDLPELDASITKEITSGGRQADCGVLKSTGNLVLGLNYCYTKHNFLCRSKSCSKKVCFELVKEKKTWFEARSHCVDLGGDLFYLKDGETWYSFTSVFNSSLLTLENSEVYIGLRHRLWEWTDEYDSEILYTNWNSYEPNTSSENCLTLDGVTGKWNDNKCDDFKFTFCQGALDETMTEAHLTSKSYPYTKAASTRPNTIATIKPAVPWNSYSTRSSGKMDLTTSTTASSSSAMPKGTDKDLILGVPLGLSLSVIGALALYLLWKRFKRDKPAVTETDNITDHYEVPVMNEYENDEMANATNNKSQLENDKSSIQPSITNDNADHYEVPLKHEYVNSNMAKATDYERLAAPS